MSRHKEMRPERIGHFGGEEPRDKKAKEELFAQHRQVGDATTLADPNVMKLIQEGLASGKTED